MTRDRALPAALVALAILVWTVPLQLGFYADAVITDIPVYREAADAMMAGDIPYRDFDLEYPPLAAALFLLVGIVPGSFGIAFQVVMAACLCATVVGVVATARALALTPLRQGLAGGAVAVSPLLLGNLVESRFDLALAALLSFMLFAAVTDRFRLMWGLFAVATLLKLMPLALVPLLVIHHRRRRDPAAAWRGVGAGLVVVAAGLAPFAALSVTGTWRMVEYHLDRPLQIESLGGAYLLGLDALVDIPIRVVNAFGSQGLEGRGPDGVALITSLATLVVVVAVAVAFARIGRRLRAPADARLLVAAWAATTAALLAGGKVLSPQFLVWLLPALFLVTGRFGATAFGLTVAGMLLTLAYFPHRYWDLVALGGPEIAILVLRDAVLIALVAAAWPRGPWAARHTEALPARRDAVLAHAPERAIASRFLTD